MQYKVTIIILIFQGLNIIILAVWCDSRSTFWTRCRWKPFDSGCTGGSHVRIKQVRFKIPAPPYRTVFVEAPVRFHIGFWVIIAPLECKFLKISELENMLISLLYAKITIFQILSSNYYNRHLDWPVSYSARINSVAWRSQGLLNFQQLFTIELELSGRD